MSTPDFDSMSPEELMAWMESLARRQGADEGFTSSVVMDVPEVDPATMQDTGPGYIPYGMSQDVWEKKQADERKRKEERRAASASAAPVQPPPAPTPPPVPVQVAPPPPPAPTPAPAAASATPDFDSMSPEELMAWMESLARRQGADEGFTSSVVMEVAEVDPATMQDTGPGYIPYGMSQEVWEKKQADERRRKEERRAASASIPTTPPPAPVPVEPPPPVPVEPPVPLPGVPTQPDPEPDYDLPPLPGTEPDESTQSSVLADNPLAWLESLGGNNDAPQFDLSSLGEPLSAPAVPAEDPMAWLESLSGQANIPGLEQFAFDTPAVPTPPADESAATTGDNPLEWLESLARRQGADQNEFTTDASLDVPLPEVAPRTQGPGYTDYSFETPPDDPSPLSFLDTIGEEDDFVAEYDDDSGDNPVSWLEALASGQIDEPADQKAPDTAEIMDALSKNQVDPNAIESWMANLLEQGAQRDDVVEYDDDDEEEEEAAVEAQLPDWLLEQVGSPPPTAPGVPSPTALVDQIIEPPSPVEMPAWLTEDMTADESMDFDNIFETDTAVPAGNLPDLQQLSTDELVMGDDDPWVEAFEMERKQGLTDISRIPDWYTEKLEQAADEAEVPFMLDLAAASAAPAATMLAPANLPDEAELPNGELQSVPDWLSEAALSAPPAAVQNPATTRALTNQVVVEDAATQDMPDWLRDQVLEETGENELPDWLREAGIEDAADVPDWLTETLSTEETPAVEPVQPVQIVPTVVAPPPAPRPTPAPAAISPAYVPPAVANIDVNQLLAAARSALQANTVDTALHNYEAIVRGNVALDQVVGDLGTLLKDETHKKNPAVYRILGDGLMRQGKLQDALDTYRKALNLL